MDKLELQILNRVDALNDEKQFVTIELIDSQTKQIIGYVYEKDLVKYWKKKVNEPKSY